MLGCFQWRRLVYVRSNPAAAVHARRRRRRRTVRKKEHQHEIGTLSVSRCDLVCVWCGEKRDEKRSRGVRVKQRPSFSCTRGFDFFHGFKL